MGDIVAGSVLKSVEKAIENVLVSQNELDSNSEPANVVDGLFAIARSIDRLALALLETKQGAHNGNNDNTMAT